MFQTISAQTEYKIDSTQQFQYDDILESLQLTQRIHYTYDNAGTKPTEHLYLKKEMGMWLDDYKFNLTYNSDNNFLTENHKEWDETNMLWLDISKGDYEYDEFQNNTVLTYYSYDEAQWNFSSRTTSEFNENNQVTNQIFENVHPITLEILKFQINYTYDENDNNILREQQNWNATSEEWENSQKDEITYNDNLIIQYDSFTWTGGPDWPTTPQYRQLYSYTNADIYNVTLQIDSGSGLTNSTKYFYTYDAERLLEFEIKSWVNDEWKENSKYTYNYDTNGNPYESYQYNWDDGSSAYVVNTKNLYFWSEAEPFALGTSSQELLLTKIYPNPASDMITVKTLSSVKTIELYDTLGKLVLTTNKSTIKVDGFQNGLYLLKIKTDKGQITKRVVIK